MQSMFEKLVNLCRVPRLGVDTKWHKLSLVVKLFYLYGWGHLLWSTIYVRRLSIGFGRNYRENLMLKVKNLLVLRGVILCCCAKLWWWFLEFKTSEADVLPDVHVETKFAIVWPSDGTLSIVIVNVLPFSRTKFALGGDACCTSITEYSFASPYTGLEDSTWIVKNMLPSTISKLEILSKSISASPTLLSLINSAWLVNRRLRI